jgi:Abnormal spindle-like microcephaly-assoc'd, ASPM-SPD-2-Hydin/Beta-propeller repeat
MGYWTFETCNQLLGHVRLQFVFVRIPIFGNRGLVGMKRIYWLAVVILLLSAQILAAGTAQTLNPGGQTKAAATLSKLPLSFEPEGSGLFRARNGNYSVSVGATESYVIVKSAQSAKANVLRWSFAGANQSASAKGVNPLAGVVNYYIGKDAANWKLGVPTFSQVRANGVYPGIDVLYYGDGRRLEFDLLVAPKADPSGIALRFSGADKVFVSPAGDLVAEVTGQQVHLAKPFAYQVKDGKKQLVRVGYVVDSANVARLELGAYDGNRELVIDPVLNYSTFVGGAEADTANGIAIDAAGNAYVTGQTCSSNLIAPSPNPSGTVFAGVNGACDAYVTKLNAAGTAVVYTTFIAGAAPTPNNATASGAGIAVDASGRAYIVGTTNFTDLPFTNASGPGSVYNGGDSDAFISILNANGTLLREAYLGGSGVDQGYGIVVDAKQNVSVVGQTCSNDFPAYNSIQAKTEACVGFITKVDFGLHIAPPVVAGASPVSPRPASLSDSCSLAVSCPVSANAAQTYYFFSTLFGGQPLPPTATWPSVGAPGYLSGVAVPNGALTIGTPQNNSCTTPPPATPLVLMATGGTSTLGISGGLQWPCTLPGDLGGIQDGAGFNWLVLGPAPAMVPYATTEAYGVAIDPVGDVFAVGGTSTATLTPYLNYAGYTGINYGKTGPWILKLNGLDGVQIYATSMGTTATDITGLVNAATGVAVDNSGDAFVVGTTSGGIMTTPGSANPNAIGGLDAFVIEWNKAASAEVYGTYVGGSGDDQGLGIALNVGSNASAYITGSTKSTDLQLVNPIANASGNAEGALLGAQDAFIARLTPTGSSLTMMAYLGGGSAEQGNGIAVDNSGDIFIAGTTESVDFPIFPAAPAEATYGGGTSDGFVVMINGASFPNASVTPASLSFGSQNVGTASSTQTFTLSNTGNGMLDITSIGVSGTTGDFSQTNNCGSQLTPVGGAKDHCTITVTFTPTAGGARSDSVKILDNSANSPQMVALSGNGTVVQGVLQLVPGSLAFGTQATGTTSTAQVITLSNTSSGYPVTISGITVGGDFKQTNNCPVSPATLAANANCSISVTFSPTAAGAQAVSLTVVGNAANSPQSIAVTGTGSGSSTSSADFTLTPSVQSVTASQGGSASFSLSAMPVNGFTDKLNLTCSVPNGATCAASPNLVTLSGTAPSSATITISVASASSSGGSTPVRTTGSLRPGHAGALFASMLLPFGLVGMTVVGKNRRLMMLLLVVLIGAMLVTISCGGGASGGSGSSNSATASLAPGTYQVSITAACASGGTTSHTITIPMTVN